MRPAFWLRVGVNTMVAFSVFFWAIAGDRRSFGDGFRGVGRGRPPGACEHDRESHDRTKGGRRSRP